MKKARDVDGVKERLTKKDKLPLYVFVNEENILDVVDYKDIFVEIISDRIRRKLNDISSDENIEKFSKM